MIPEDKHFYINILKEEKLKELVEKLSNETDFVIVCMNWGDKNSPKPNKKMIKLFYGKNEKKKIFRLN